jgi:hypothetical protein
LPLSFSEAHHDKPQSIHSVPEQLLSHKYTSFGSLRIYEVPSTRSAKVTAQRVGNADTLRTSFQLEAYQVSHVLSCLSFLLLPRPIFPSIKTSHDDTSSRVRIRDWVRVPSHSTNLGVVQAKRHLRRVYCSIHVCARRALIRTILLPFQLTQVLLRVARESSGDRLCRRWTSLRRTTERSQRVK